MRRAGFPRPVDPSSLHWTDLPAYCCRSCVTAYCLLRTAYCVLMCQRSLWPFPARLARALLCRSFFRFSSVLSLIRCWAFQAASPARSEALAMALLTMSIPDPQLAEGGHSLRNPLLLLPTHVTWKPHDGQN